MQHRCKFYGNYLRKFQNMNLYMYLYILLSSLHNILYKFHNKNTNIHYYIPSVLFLLP